MDVRDFKQSGYYFSHVSFEMSELIKEMVVELEEALKGDGFTVLIDSIPIRVWDVISLKNELQIALLTEKINVNLLPVELVMGSKKWENLQILINKNSVLRRELMEVS